MPLVQLPFQKGQDSKIEAKVAPSGLLKTLSNARMTKLSRVAKRGGAVAASLTGQNGAAVVSGSLPTQAVFLHSSGELFSALQSQGDDYLYGTSAEARRVFRGLLSPWEAPELIPIPQAWQGRCSEVSSAYANGYICTVFSTIGENAAVAYAAIVDTSGRLRSFAELDAGTVIRRPRVVACGNSFVAFWAENTSNERIVSANFATGTAGASWSAIQDVTNGLTFLAGSFDFDICAFSATQVALVFRRSSTELSVLLWAFGAGTATGPTNVTADGIGLAVLGATGEGVSIAWRDESDGAVKINSFNDALASLAGPTTVDAGPAIGPVTLRRDGATTRTALWSESTTSPVVQRRPFTPSTHSFGAGAATIVRGGHLASKPVVLSDGDSAFWLVNTGTFQRNYVLSGFDSGGTNARPQLVAARDLATPATVADHLSEVPLWADGSISRIAWGHARILAGTTEATGDLLLSPGLLTAKLRGTQRAQTAGCRNALLFASGAPVGFDGVSAQETGFLLPPQITALTEGTSGSLTVLGSYQYVVTMRFYDARGNVTISQVSDPVAITLTGANDDVTVRWSRSDLSTRRVSGDIITALAGDSPAMLVDVWRTLNNGEIFYRVSDADGEQISAGTYVDTMSDADAETQPVLYTQGERGGLSGPLQNDTPPPCRFIWAGKDRIGCSGLEDPSEYQFSKLFFPGEAVHFSNHRSFRGRIPGRAGPIFCLDDIWAVFSTDGLYTISGAGPDDTGQGGFDEPRKHASHVGCNEWRSLCECPQGLTFQGNDGELWLLPRGFGAPMWIGRNVSDQLATYPVVTSATLVPEEHIVAFTVTTSDGASGRLLCYDYTQLDEQGIGLWSVDTIAGGVAHISGALWDGKLALATTSAIDVMTPGTYSDRASTWYGVTIETHPIKPSGFYGDGRTRMIGVMAEYRGDCGLDIRIAVNDSQTFSSAHSFVDATAALGATVGDQILRGWQIPFQKGGSYAVRLSETQDASTLTEGLAFVGIALDYRPREGMRRISPVNR